MYYNNLHVLNESPPREKTNQDTKRNLHKQLKKLCEKLDARHVSLSPTGNLILKGQQELAAEHYVVASPQGLFAKMNGRMWQPKGQNGTLPVEIGVIAGDACFVRMTMADCPGKYLDREHPPAPDEVLLMLVITTRFVEFYAVTPALKAFHLLRPTDDIGTVAGLFFDILRGYRLQDHETLVQFMTEAIPRFGE